MKKNIDINSKPGIGIADKHVDSKNQPDSATEIFKSSSESIKVIPDKLKKSSTGLVRFDIKFLTAEISCQSNIKNYVTRGHIYFSLTLPW